MELKQSTQSLLCDEAYAFLCRSALQEELSKREQESAALALKRPPFGLLASRKARESFEQACETSAAAELALRERIEHLVRIENWVRRSLHRELSIYLEAASPDYQLLAQLQALHDGWEKGLVELPELLTRFARDLRGVRSAATPPANDAAELGRQYGLLREIAVRIEDKQLGIDRIANEVATYALKLAAKEVRMPALPSFRRTVWVDWLCAIPVEQALSEITRVEFEARTFLNGGLQAARARLQAARAWCMLTKENLLNQYWEQLRAHAQAHYVVECDVEDVLARLGERYDSAIEANNRCGEVKPGPRSTHSTALMVPSDPPSVGSPA
ncbi:hypothetical protein [Horticoccus sp. 23ND18S-11]|uniref:hypothetical protein n=1 Tax=Horticoccus sp. 23ND18S-11 TaxID=3391832 RepID=UPI0039C9E1DD